MEISHMMFLGNFNTDIFVAITLVVGTLLETFFGQKGWTYLDPNRGTLLEKQLFSKNQTHSARAYNIQKIARENGKAVFAAITHTDLFQDLALSIRIHKCSEKKSKSNITKTSQTNNVTSQSRWKSQKEQKQTTKTGKNDTNNRLPNTNQSLHILEKPKKP